MESGYRRSFTIEPALCVVAALAMPVILYVVGLATLDRLLYPACSLLLAGYLYYKRSPWYVGLCVWLFCATPLVRRLADEQSGWDPSNPILLTPYLACAFTVFSLMQLGSKQHVAPFAIVLACIGYGFLLAVLDTRVFSGLVDVMKWSVGPLFALFVLARGEQRSELHRVAVISFLIAGPAMAVYGIVQYVSPSPWDADWMVNVASLGLTSIGNPRPYDLRVFSTMNSPGSFGIVLSTAILIALQQKRFVIVLVTVLPMIIGLLLCQYRAIWAGTIFGIVCLLITGPFASKIRMLVVGAAMVFMAGSAAIVPQIRQTVADRIDTLEQLEADGSGEDRLHQYQHFFDQGDELVLGQGLAIDGSSRRLDKRNSVVVDSGFIKIISTLGIFGGAVFIVAIIMAAKLTFVRISESCPDIPLYRAIAIATFSQLPFGGVYIGEEGFGAWLCIGLAAAAISNRAVPTRPASTAILVDLS